MAEVAEIWAWAGFCSDSVVIEFLDSLLAGRPYFRRRFFFTFSPLSLNSVTTTKGTKYAKKAKYKNYCHAGSGYQF